jgi:putative transposase
MPRKHRFHFFGAIYHVILRGNNKQKIFFHDLHKKQFCDFIQESIKNFNYKIHAYCLMPNHIHLIVQVGEIPLTQIMHNVASRYSKWFNFKLKRVGHLFQGRYRAFLVQDEKYILELCRYIHLNPVRAELVKLPQEYIWSSHGAYLGLVSAPWLTMQFIQELLGKHFFNNGITYADFIKNGLDEGFMPTLLRVSDDENIFHDLSMQEEGKRIVPLEFIIEIVCNKFNICMDDLVLPSKKRTLVKARAIIALCAKQYCNISINKLADLFRQSQSTLSTNVNGLKKHSMQEIAPILELIERCPLSDMGFENHKSHIR